MKFINLTAAKRIIRKLDSNLNCIRIWTMPNGAIGYVALDKSTGKKVSSIMSKQKFFQDGIEFRKEAGKLLKVQILAQDYFRVHSADMRQSGYYEVDIYRGMGNDQSDFVNCGCEDFRSQANQLKAFCKPYCKHIAAVHQHLGYGSIAEMMRNKQAVFTNKQIA